MKQLLGWMHRKIRRNVDFCMVFPKEEDFDSFDGEIPKTRPSIASERDTRALLFSQPGDAPLVDPLDGWREGILAIGTFGLDGFSLPDAEFPAQDQLDYSVAWDEEALGVEAPAPPYSAKSGDDEDEEAFGSELDAADEEEAKSDDQPKSGSDPAEHGSVFASPDCTVLIVAAATKEISCEDSDEDKEKKTITKKKGERTTLADLFYADASDGASINTVEKKKIELADNHPSNKEMKKKEKKEKKENEQREGRSSKQMRSLAKKLTSWKGEDSLPTAKLQRLLTKIMKRKIHPDLGQVRELSNGFDQSVATEN